MLWTDFFSPESNNLLGIRWLGGLGCTWELTGKISKMGLMLYHAWAIDASAAVVGACSAIPGRSTMERGMNWTFHFVRLRSREGRGPLGLQNHENCVKYIHLLPFYGCLCKFWYFCRTEIASTLFSFCSSQIKFRKINCNLMEKWCVEKIRVIGKSECHCGGCDV